MASTCFRRPSSALLLTTLTTLTILARPAAAGVDRWTPIGPEGGEIVSLAADPDAPGTLYAGTAGGGVWKSLDGGGSWVPTVEGLAAVPISSLAVSAGRVYAGTFNTYGLHVLTDGAVAWRPVGPFPFGVYDLAVDPTDPERIWTAGFSRGGDIVASEDGGEHWTPKLRLRHSFLAVAVAPTVPPTVYAGGDEGVFASRDGGMSWRPFDPGETPPWAAPFSVRDLQVDPLDAETLYATAYSGFWRTRDEGEHWVQVIDALDTYDQLLSLPGALLVVVRGGLLRSEDGGDTWDPVDGNWGEISDLAADPTAPGGAWVTTWGGGLFRTSDGGRTWAQSARRGLRATSIRAFAFDPFRPRTLYAVLNAFTPTARLQRSFDAGASWSPSPTLPLLDVRSLAADPRRPATLYAGTPRGVWVSRDRGTHWQRILHEPRGIEAVAVDPHRPGTIWAAGKRVWRSRDAGRTWKLLARRVAHPTAMAQRIFLSPWHPETLYLVDSFLTLSRSTDGGATWERIDEGSPVALAFDPTTPDLLYLADGSGNIRKSRDGGTTWEQVASVTGGDVGLTALLIDPLDPAVFYVGTAGNGVWRSLDKGVTWQPFSAGLIAPLVTCLEADPRNPRRLVACTQGGGLQEMRISSGS